MNSQFSIVDPEIKSIAAQEDKSVGIWGQNGELLRVGCIEQDVVRVTHLVDGQMGQGIDRTWIISNGEDMHELRGWDRMNREGFKDIALEQQDSVSTLRIGQDLRVRINHQFGAEYVPFRLEWFRGDEEQKSFASDSFLQAYAYEKGGKATHRMQRRPEEEKYYGLGEVSGPLNRAGRRFRLQCRDAMGYDAKTSDPLYKHFPFYITYNKAHKIAYGILYDQLCGGVIDLGLEISAFRGSYRTCESESGLIDYYFIVGPTIPEVVEKAGRLLGRPAVPPGWALGYVASTMTYSDAPDAQRRLEAFPDLCEKHDMPCSGFYLSSGYTMDNDGNRNVFTWNYDRVPKPEEMLNAFHKKNISVIANVKPWLLKAHPQYEKMRQAGAYFKTQETNAPLSGWFWKGGPGTYASGAYLDFTNPVVFNWWKENLEANLLKQGVDSIWNDNNEFEIDDSSAQCFHEKAPIGRLGRALQTLLMGRASYEALLEYQPEKRPLVVSRSGCLGISRYCAQTWSGDNSTSFHTLRWNIPMSLGLSLCGWVSHGADIGGFSGDAVTPELFVRWIQIGIYMARFSIHSASWKKSANDAELDPNGYNLDCTNEPWMFPEYTDTVRDLLRLRYRLRATLLSLHLEAFLNSYPVMRPLVFHFADDETEKTHEESFEFMLGENLLVAPVMEESATSVDVYFPGDTSKETWIDMETGTKYSGGQTENVQAELLQRQYGVPIFLRSGGGLVLSGDDQNCLDNSIRTIVIAMEDEALVSWYEDPTPNQEGRVDRRNIIKITIHTQFDSASDTIELTSCKITQSSNQTLPFKTIQFKLLPGDTRNIHIPQNIQQDHPNISFQKTNK